VQGGTRLSLEGLSHEIDFKNVDKYTELSLSKGRGWFLNFLGAHNAKSVFIVVNASLRWPNNISCVFLSVPTNQRPSIF
jgi:hypothetical protein